jgi:two-component system sensor histidine kinase DegS
MIACSDGSIRALNRPARLLFGLEATTSSLFDVCASSHEGLQAHLIRCSGSRQPFVELVSLVGQDGTAEYRCYGSALVPRRRSHPATLLLRLFPALDARFSAGAEQMRRALAERRWRLALDQAEELRQDRARLVEQYCFVVEALRVAEEQKLELQNEITQARADERERIAHDLHDHAGQEMTLVLLELRRMRDAARGPARDRLDELAAHVAQVGRQIHHAVVSGRPRIVEEFGLARAIELTAASFATDGELGFSFKSRGARPERLLAPVENALYRVAQEALANALKHGQGAQKIDVVLEFGATTVSLAITDDGSGFPTEAQHSAEPQHSQECGRVGLRGMRRRMNSIGGTLQIDSRPGRGTTITAIAPLKPGPKRSVQA